MRGSQSPRTAGRIRAATGLLAVGSLGILACAEGTPRPVPSAPFVLVTLDTFRADHLGRIGGAGHRLETPNLDALADRGTLYSRALAPAPQTVPSHATLLTGEAPASHGAITNRSRLDRPTIASQLRDAGWRTGAFVSSFVLARHTGLDAGFETYDDLLGLRERIGVGSLFRDRFPPTAERRGDRTAAAAIDWLQRGTTRSFLWIHLYDPHAPYDPPPPWDRHYDASGADAPGNPQQVRASMAGQGWTNLFVPQDLRAAVARYAGEVSWTDAVVGTLVAALPADATIVVVSDHGESLVEHGEFLGHGRTLYEPSLRVFAIAAGPGIARAVVDDPIPLDAIGRALVPLATTGAGLPVPDSEPIWAFTYGERSEASVDPDPGPRFASYDGPTKWIVDGRGNVRAFQWREDPGEMHDVAAEDPTAAAIVLAESQALRAQLEAARSTESAVRALGYTE
jgi:arylsulfatase A-like enzyme